MPNYINNAENIYKYFSFYKILPLRVREDQEIKGLDLSQHGESL